MPPVLVRLVDALVRRGHRVEIRAVHDDSYAALVRNALGQVVGTIEYRSPLDEPVEYARGLSYAGVFDQQRWPDRTFAVVRHALSKMMIEPPYEER
jgi:hypothetical protein